MDSTLATSDWRSTNSDRTKTLVDAGPVVEEVDAVDDELLALAVVDVEVRIVVVDEADVETVLLVADEDGTEEDDTDVVVLVDVGVTEEDDADVVVGDEVVTLVALLVLVLLLPLFTVIVPFIQAEWN
jgi:hypothetical protein